MNCKQIANYDEECTKKDAEIAALRELNRRPPRDLVGVSGTPRVASPIPVSISTVASPIPALRTLVHRSPRRSDA